MGIPHRGVSRWEHGRELCSVSGRSERGDAGVVRGLNEVALFIVKALEFWVGVRVMILNFPIFRTEQASQKSP
jgi:hypothetical protein